LDDPELLLLLEEDFDRLDELGRLLSVFDEELDLLLLAELFDELLLLFLWSRL